MTKGSVYNKIVKRILDIIFAMILIVAALLPAAIIILALLIANGPRGVFFTQSRPGLNGKIFKIFKFKTMTDACDERGELLPDEQRITPIGKILRVASLDELPQLVNVLIGDMSFVGPRPLLSRYLPFYTEEENCRHSVRPGITGYAQISGRNHLNWDQRLAFDVYYVRNIGFMLDCRIIFCTISKVIIGEGVDAVPNNGYLDEYRAPRIQSKQGF